MTVYSEKTGTVEEHEIARQKQCQNFDITHCFTRKPLFTRLSLLQVVNSCLFRTGSANQVVSTGGLRDQIYFVLERAVAGYRAILESPLRGQCDDRAEGRNNNTYRKRCGLSKSPDRTTEHMKRRQAWVTSRYEGVDGGWRLMNPCYVVVSSRMPPAEWRGAVTSRTRSETYGPINLLYNAYFEHDTTSFTGRL